MNGLRKGGNHGVRYVLRRRPKVCCHPKGKHDECGVIRPCPCHFQTSNKMLELVRAFVGSPLSTFRYLSLPTGTLLVSPISPSHSPSRVQLFTALSIRRYSGHPRRHLSSPCPHARLFSGLSQPRSSERAYHIPCGRSRVETCRCLSPHHHHNAFPTHCLTPRWLPLPARGLPFGPSLESPPALGLFTHRSFSLMTSTSQLSTVDPVSLPCCYVLFTITHLVQVSWPSQRDQRCLYTL